ncbi:hypothetical protein EJ02DRAFT_52044 [Clathrospora elynae]|uniref:Ribonucleases P/MRP subunit Pop8-like domain-containing protein n=1 Tax=Clathrospora elynae TaxID=706981 RepID=A0A6A5T8H9_9PLEO|nr:hypothetical protein EJ02DRAFT_52044 [Clathrospora elynae]
MVPIPPPSKPSSTATIERATVAQAPAKRTNASERADTDAATPVPPTSPENPKKRKRKANEPHILHQATFRKTSWSYLHLCLLTPGTATLPLSSSAPNPPSSATSPTTPVPNLAPNAINSAEIVKDISPLLTSTLLTSPLHSYLGQTGAAIPIDILKTRSRDVWIRIPRQDVRAFRASLSGWVGSCEGGDVWAGNQGRVQVGWRVVCEAGALGICGGDGADLFK